MFVLGRDFHGRFNQHTKDYNLFIKLQLVNKNADLWKKKHETKNDRIEHSAPNQVPKYRKKKNIQYPTAKENIQFNVTWTQLKWSVQIDSFATWVNRTHNTFSASSTCVFLLPAY